MKKIFFLLVAFVCSLSLSAAVPAQKAQMTKSGLVALVFTKSDEVQKNRAQKIADHKQAIETAKAQRQAQAPKRVALTDADTVFVTIDEIAVENYGSNDFPNYLIMLYGVDAKGSDEYYVALDCYPTIDEYVGINVNTAYDENYMQTLGSYFYSAVNNLTTNEGFWLNDPIEDDPTSVSSFSADTISAGLWKVEGNFICENGVVYVVKGENIAFNHPAKLDAQTTQVQSVDYGTDVWFQFYEEVDGGVNAYTLDVLVDGALESGKTYVYNDDVQEMDLAYSYIYFSNPSSIRYITEAQFTPTLDGQGEFIAAEFVLKTDLGDEIRGRYEKPAVPESYTDVYLTANYVDLYDATATEGVFQFLGVSEDGQWNLSVAAAATTLIGEHSELDLLTDFCYIGFVSQTVDYVKHVVEVKNVKVVDAGSSIDPTVTGPQYTCTADFYCYDGNCYHLTLNRIAPAIETTYNFRGLNMKHTIDEMSGLHVFYSHDAIYDIAVGIAEWDQEGFAKGDVQASIYNLNDDEDAAIYSLAGVQVKFDGDRATQLFAKILLKNGELVYVVMDSTPLDPTDDDLNMDVNTVTSQLRETEDGFFVELNSNNDERLYLDFSKALTSVLGTNVDLLEANAATSYFTPEASGYYSTQYTIDAGFLRLDRVGEDTLGFALYHVKAKALVSALLEDYEREETEGDGKYYYYDDVKYVNVDTIIRFKAGLEADEEIENAEVAYTLDEVNITPNLAEGWFLLQGNANGYAMAVVFFNDHEDADITIPEGDYTFASTMENNTCFVSPGLDETGAPQASFLAETDPILTFLVNKVWFLTAGTAKVAKNEDNQLMVLIEATNSNRRTVTINVNDYHIPTALPNINDDVKGNKFLHNGQLLIRKNGKTYNVVGAEL